VKKSTMTLKLNLFTRQEHSENKSLIVLIHGLGAPNTWIAWKKRFLEDSQMMHIDIALAEYETGHICCPWASSYKAVNLPFIEKTLALGKLSNIKTLSHALKCELEQSKFSQYDKVVLIGHSMGGLIAAWYLTSMIESRITSKVIGYISVATPFNGSNPVEWYLRIFPHHPQIADLAPNSDFLDELQKSMEAQKYELMEMTSFVNIYAERDGIVRPTSSIPKILESRWQSIILPEGHSNVLHISPKDEERPYCYIRDEIFKALAGQRVQDLKSAIENVKTAQEYWHDWTANTDPVIREELFLAGRENVVEKIREWIKSGINEVVIYAKSRDEALLTFVSAINKDIDSIEDECIQHIYVILNEKAWTVACNIAVNAILIPIFRPLNNLIRPLKCRMMIPFSQNEVKPSKNIIEISKQSVPQVVSGLEKIGVSLSAANDIVEKARNNLHSIRRQLSKNSWALTPDWTRRTGVETLIPSLLVGQWHESCEGDKRIIGNLSRSAYDEYARKIVAWLSYEETPIAKTFDKYEMIGLDEAWDYLYEKIIDADIENFRQCLIEVFNTADPTYDLNPDQWYMASILNKKPVYTNGLYTGLATTLILLAIREDRPNNFNIVSTQGQVDYWVREIFSQINTWEKWFTIVPQLQLLAEASPDETLDAVEREISNINSQFWQLFRITGDGMFVKSQYTHLLWALEMLAWHPNYFSRACMILAMINENHIEFKLSNSPIDSLIQIFMPWHPQTTVSADDRIEVLTKILEQYPKTGWNLVINLLPQIGSVGNNNPKPKWRNWGFEYNKPITNGEYDEHIKKISNLVIRAAENNFDRWIDILGHIGSLRLKCIDDITVPLAQQKNSFSISKQIAIWNKLREEIGKHRKFSSAVWALPEPILNALEQVYLMYEPDDMIEKKRYLFITAFPQLLNPIPYKRNEASFEREQKKARQVREEALTEIFHCRGEEGLLRLLETCENGYEIGAILIEKIFIFDLNLPFLLKLLKLKKSEIVNNYFYVFCDKKGFEILISEIKNALASMNDESERMQLLHTLPFRPETWQFIDELDEAAQRSYWQDASILTCDRDQDALIVKYLLRFDRPYSAIKYLSYKDHIDTELILGTLEKCLVFHPQQESSGMRLEDARYEIIELFKYLYKQSNVDRLRIFFLEWGFFPLFDDDLKPAVLFDELCKSPDSFVELIFLAYRGDIEESDPPPLDQQQKIKAERARDILRKYNFLPGFSGGRKDIEMFNKWCATVLSEWIGYTKLDNFHKVM
jgi:hypothetical protein